MGGRGVKGNILCFRVKHSAVEQINFFKANELSNGWCPVKLLYWYLLLEVGQPSERPFNREINNPVSVFFSTSQCFCLANSHCCHKLPIIFWL